MMNKRELQKTAITLWLLPQIPLFAVIFFISRVGRDPFIIFLCMALTIAMVVTWARICDKFIKKIKEVK